MSDEERSGGGAYLKYLLSLLRCPVCHHHYTSDDILALGQTNSLWLMALSCPECETQGLVFAVIESESKPEESLTELTAEEFIRFKERGAITIDDVLDFHELLRDYHGDMAGLLGDEG